MWEGRQAWIIVYYLQIDKENAWLYYNKMSKKK